MTPPVETRPPAQGPTQRTSPRVRTTETIVAAVLVVAAVWLLATDVLFNDPAHLDKLRVDNPSEYDIDIAISPDDPAGRVLVGRAVQECGTAFHKIVDQGPIWVIHFRTQGQDGGEVRIDRSQLEHDDWTLRIPDDVIERFRTDGAPQPPTKQCPAEYDARTIDACIA